MRSRIKTGVNKAIATDAAENRTLSIAFGLSAVFLILVLLIFPVRYETNDDFALVTELSGLNPTPVSFVLNPITSYCLYFLYQKVPSLPWYGILIYFCIFLGISLLTNIFIRVGNRRILFCIGPFLFIFFFRSYAFPGLTSASLLLLFAVFLNFLQWTQFYNNSRCHNRAYLGILLTGLFASFLLRWELVTYALSFAAPIFLFFNQSVKRLFRPLVFSFVFIILLFPIAAFYLNSGDNQFYNEYSRLRKKFHDTDQGDYYKDVTPKALAMVGWEYEDYVLLKNCWFLYDQNQFNSYKLTTFLKNNSPLQKNPLIGHISNRIKDATRKSTQYLPLFILTIVLILFYRALYPSNTTRIEIWKKYLSITMVLAGLLFFMYYRFEPRIFLPLCTYFIGITIVIFFKERHVEKHHGSFMRKLIITVILVATATAYGLAFSTGRYLLKDLAASYNNKQYIQSQFRRTDLQAIDKEKSLLISINQTENLMIETVHPLKEKKDYTDFKILPFGWQINSLQYYRILKGFGLSKKDSLLQWTVNNPKVFWFQLFYDSSDNQRVNLIKNYFSRHVVHGKSVNFEPIFDFRNQEGIGFVFYHLTLKES